MTKNFLLLFTSARIPINETDDANIPMKRSIVTNNLWPMSLDMSLLSANIHIDIIAAVIPASYNISWRQLITLRVISNVSLQ